MFNYLISKKERLLDWFAYTFNNPYLVQVNGWCPRQAEGFLSDGNYYYFRARGDKWYLKISTIPMKKDSTTNFFSNQIFHYGNRSYKPWPECGWLSERECIRLATKALDNYFNKKMNTFELCPNRNGQKTVSRPPYVAGDVDIWTSGGTAIYPCPTCEARGVIETRDNPVVGNYYFQLYKCPRIEKEDNKVPFAYSIALVDKNEDESGVFYTYLDFWVVKDLNEVKKTLKRRGVTANSKNYQIKAFYADGSWDFVSLREVLA